MCSINELMKASFDTVLLSQITAKCLLARVTATLILLFSDKKPICFSEFERTKDKIIISFSLP